MLRKEAISATSFYHNYLISKILDNRYYLI